MIYNNEQRNFSGDTPVKQVSKTYNNGEKT